jgi:aerobic carbon-monoxide dehydrogenase medium subunit
MKPSAFEYHRPESLEEAVEVLGRLDDEGRILAGGQSLVPLMNFRLAQPTHVVDINRLGDLDYVRADGGTVRIGALARQSTVEADPAVAERLPLLREALAFVAHPTIRHRGTVVGSVAHADPAAELPTVTLALAATVTVRGGDGTREVAAADFFLGPFETAIEPGELVVEIAFPTSSPGSGYGFVEFARRHGDFAIAGAAVTLALRDGVVAEPRVILCGVGPVPLRATAAEAALDGAAPDEEAIEAAASAAVEGVEPPGDMHGGTRYRIGVARAQVRRAVVKALDRAKGTER